MSEQPTGKTRLAFWSRRFRLVVVTAIPTAMVVKSLQFTFPEFWEGLSHYSSGAGSLITVLIVVGLGTELLLRVIRRRFDGMNEEIVALRRRVSGLER